MLAELAAAEVELFALTVLKGGRGLKTRRRTTESWPVSYCSLFWPVYPNVALAIDRHFTSPAQVATVNTWIHRRWPPPGVLSIVHADSQRNTLVQPADMVAGSVYAWINPETGGMRLIAEKFGATVGERLAIHQRSLAGCGLNALWKAGQTKNGTPRRAHSIP